jgi:hypothetical protein
MKWLFNRWQLKTIAMVLALSLYLYTGTQVSVERTITVRISDRAVEGLPGDYLITGIAPREFDVVVSGPMTVVRGIDQDDLQPMLAMDASSVAAGRADFDITGRLLQLSPELSLRRSSAGSIAVDFARIAEEVLPIADRPKPEGLAEGLRAQIALVRAQVLVRGPSTAIDELREAGPIPVESLDLSSVKGDIDGPVELRLPLELKLSDDPRLRAKDIPEVIVTVTPEPENQVVGPLPIQLLADPDYLLKHRVVIDPAVIALNVSGPANLMAETDLAKEVRAYIDMSGVRPSGKFDDRLVRVLKPTWATTSAVQVRVKVEFREDGPPPPVEGDGDGGDGDGPGPQPPLLEDSVDEPEPPPPAG